MKHWRSVVQLYQQFRVGVSYSRAYTKVFSGLKSIIHETDICYFADDLAKSIPSASTESEMSEFDTVVKQQQPPRRVNITYISGVFLQSDGGSLLNCVRNTRSIEPTRVGSCDLTKEKICRFQQCISRPEWTRQYEYVSRYRNILLNHTPRLSNFR
jgi:hypothetical protein